jgi:hypothetical protein
MLPITEGLSNLIMARQLIGNIFSETEETIYITLAKKIDVGEAVVISFPVFIIGNHMSFTYSMCFALILRNACVLPVGGQVSHADHLRPIEH